MSETSFLRKMKLVNKIKIVRITLSQPWRNSHYCSNKSNKEINFMYVFPIAKICLQFLKNRSNIQKETYRRKLALDPQNY